MKPSVLKWKTESRGRQSDFKLVSVLLLYSLTFPIIIYWFSFISNKQIIPHKKQTNLKDKLKEQRSQERNRNLFLKEIWMTHPSKRRPIAREEGNKTHGWVFSQKLQVGTGRGLPTCGWKLTCVVLCCSRVGKQKQSFQQFRGLGMMDYATDNLEKNQAMDTVMLLADKHWETSPKLSRSP